MFIPKDRESVLELPNSQNSRIQSIVATRERKFIAVATSDSIFIWLSNPQLLLCSIGVDNDAWKDTKGELRQIYWRPDSQAIAVTTNRNQMFIYAIEIQPEESCYNFLDSEDPYFQRNSHELFIKSFRPIVTIKPVYNISLADVATRCVAFREELLVCVQNGFTHHVTWDGDIIRKLSFRLTSIPFSSDQLQSKSEYITSNSTYIRDTVYAPLIGGYLIVLSDGQAGLLTSNDGNFAPNTILGVWAQNLKDAECCDMNHKFLLMLFGCKNGDVCAYNIDEQSGSLIQSFRVSPRVTNGPDFTNRLGPVQAIRAIPSGYGFAAIWSPIQQSKNDTKEVHYLSRVLTVFTSCGAQSFCNLENVVEEYGNDEEERSQEQFTSIEWGPEGYQLWLGTTSNLQIQPFIRSASCGSPVMEHCDRVVMASDSQVLISAARDKEADACAPHSVWDHITVTHEYLSSNWPIRYASIDRDYNHLAVAGDRGFAYCSMSTRKWKIFGNESQEKNLVVTGGLFIWSETIGVVGADMDTDKAHLSFYPISQKLDNKYASTVELENKATMVALRDDVCALFDISAQITLFKLSVHDDKGRDSYVKVTGDIVSVIRINELILHPACVVSIQMTKLNIDVRGKPTPVFHSTIDTVLINIAGRLITLSVNDDGKLHQPIVIASYVEKMWHDRCIVVPPSSSLSSTFSSSKDITEGWKSHTRSSSNLSTPSTSTISNPPSPFSESCSSHLNNALWIACGARGIKVWMPLIPGRRSTSTQEMTFIAKRIMLPFELDIYPVVICASDCLAMGVESQLHHVAKSSKERGKAQNISVYGLHRNSEVFVHHLLRQLLKRNLGVFALELAAACRSLPHFSHSLELLLHGVLEEEATSSEPIPDPLLPRCVAFIHEFPEFLKTIAHCARKTELALWPTLFDVTGSPNALFEECLRQGQLENASSFVIVLQNFENTETSMEQAARLVRDALEAKKWTIAQEMVRFARSIGSEDIDLVTPPPSAKTSMSRRPTVSSPTGINEQSNEFVINRFQAGGAARLSKVRHSQTIDSKDSSSQRKDSTGSSTKEKMNLSRGLSGELSPPVVANRLAVRMMSILEEHCWHLLNNYWILDLGFFWAELQFDVCGLLETRRKQLLLSPKTTNDNCYLVEDFALALTRLHAQFCWPYPVVGTQFVHQIEKKLGALKNSQSTASLNGLVEDSKNLEKKIETMNLKPKKVERTVVKLENTRRISSDDDGEVEIREAVLERVMGTGNDDDLVTSSVRSESHSSPNNPSGLSVPTPSSSDSRSLAGDWQSADYLIGERARGNSEKTRQIEYMLNLFVQSSAIDWIFLMCLITRDEKRLRQEINLNLVKKVGEKNIARVRFACSELGRWAIEKCCGYITLLQAFDAHLTVVAEQAGIADLKYSSAKRDRNNSTDEKTEERRGRESQRVSPNNNYSKLGSTFSPISSNGSRRERSRSADRVHRSVRRYDDVVCAEDALEKADEDGCSIM